ncbi:ATP phosphoribosyltransferase regulatory subunit [Thiohalorhabdus sp.]|uniref:ATP phosphoribosyltransferase regulatory subunit n=1 Tax=Thiohalorhabdus sp. TaxID=3094134 RepID=UPI002FC28ABB
MNRWLLPQGIEDVLPERAEAVEGLRRRVLDVYHRWGYALVMPPEVEFLDSLLTGVGGDLDLRTLKVVDQASGRLMGFRADMTPQVARVDAHRMPEDGPSRLCYAGPVLRAHPDNYGSSRAPLQVGAEVFGVASPSADAEIIGLMAATLSEVGIRDFILDMGHVGLYRALTRDLGLDGDRGADLREAIRRKDTRAVAEVLANVEITPGRREALMRLPTLHGGPDVLETARSSCGVNEEARAALAELGELVERLGRRDLADNLSFDLGEVRGYDYHTGPVFAAFVAGQGDAVLRGGRYDGIGAAFGRSRPATGMSGDLKQLAELMPLPPSQPQGVLAPLEGTGELQRAIQSLRAQGVRVVQCLEAESDRDLGEQARRLGCAQVLEYDEHHGWRAQPVDTEE